MPHRGVVCEMVATATLVTVVGLAVPAAGVAVAPAAPARWGHVAELRASDGARGDIFGSGSAISADGSTAVVGADGYAKDSGKAYVFVRHGSGRWRQAAILTGKDGTYAGRFGEKTAISADGSTILVAAPEWHNQTGAAYVFTRHGTTWRQSGQLLADDGAQFDYFGEAVALSADGTTAVVSSTWHNGLLGAAYVFTLRGGTWTMAAELSGPDTEGEDWFGDAAAVSGDGSTILVGADGHVARGSAYVFTRRAGSWTSVQELRAGGGGRGANFGYSMAISPDGTHAVIGANNAHGVGTAYVFALGAKRWRETAALSASDAAPVTDFGCSVALSASGSTVAVGAPWRDAAKGTVYVFDRHSDGWVQSGEIEAPDARRDDGLGGAVSVTGDGSAVLSGAGGHHDDRGAAYVFRR